MDRELRGWLAGAALFMAAVLLLDRPGVVPQLLSGLATTLFLWLFCRRFGIAAAQVLCCIAVATTGEVILSLGWGLYSYAHALIPLYVPPGHGLFYALALATSRQQPLLQRERRITIAVLCFGTLTAVASLIAYGDTWGFLWWVAAMALIVTSRSQLMLSACFAYTILLEWFGTANGNWLWAAEVPFLRLTSANPPAGVGVLYIVLDLVVVGLTARLVGGHAVAVVLPEAEPQPAIAPASLPNAGAA
jgi:hypothetical protein